MRRLMLLAAATMLVAAKHAPDAPLLLNPGNFDPAALLPEPPRDDSALGKAELAQLHVIDASRTPEETASAKADGAVKNVTIFAGVMGPGFDLDKLPATKALFQTVRQEEKAAADRAKDHFKRNRPWISDSSLHPCATNDDPQSSYPSGHTSMGYAMGAILARLAPSKAPAIMARAAEYAHSRLVCEVHFPGDVAAGQAFGMVIAERLMEQPGFVTQFEAARSELAKAGLAR
jgi:acid phosphatase (class A)